MLTLRSCFSNKFLTSWDNYLNFAPNNFKLNSFSDNITFVCDIWMIIISPEHTIYIIMWAIYFAFKVKLYIYYCVA